MMGKSLRRPCSKIFPPHNLTAMTSLSSAVMTHCVCVCGGGGGGGRREGGGRILFSVLF